MADAVHLSRPADGIAVVRIEDREARNTFSARVVQGLEAAFARFGKDESVRAVVVHGYDSVFCAGGTLEELLAIADGRLEFAAGPFYRLLLDCPVPVVSAMQGHALGGGFTFGLYADLVVLAEESLYSANFMKYGFTPGMGATAVLPAKLGTALAAEMMMTAAGFHGGVLRDRGVPFPVVPRAQVVERALRLARDLADKPRGALVLLKERLTAALRAELETAIPAETRMHERTFSEPGTRRRIEERFGK